MKVTRMKNQLDELAKALASTGYSRREALRRLGLGMSGVVFGALGLGRAGKAWAGTSDYDNTQYKSAWHKGNGPGICLNYCRMAGFEPGSDSYQNCWDLCHRLFTKNGDLVNAQTGATNLQGLNNDCCVPTSGEVDEAWCGTCAGTADAYPYCLPGPIETEGIPKGPVGICGSPEDPMNDGAPCGEIDLAALFGGAAFCYVATCVAGVCSPQFVNDGMLCVPDTLPPTDADGRRYYGVCDAASASCTWAPVPEPFTDELAAEICVW